MTSEQFLKDHEAEALKKIAEAMGKIVFIRTQAFSYKEVCYCDPSGNEEVFNPLINAEQWIECLVWYNEERSTWNQRDILTDFWNATVSREALLIAILRMIGGWDEKEI